MRNLSKLEFFILDLLIARGAMYGLEMVRESEGVLKRGTIYVTLNRMCEKGYVESFVADEPYLSGKPRPRYTVTGHGQRTFQNDPRNQKTAVPEPTLAPA